MDGSHNLFDLESIDTCKSCLLGKMTKEPFSRQREREMVLLGIIHTDVCDPLNTPAKGGYQCFITFINDISKLCLSNET